MDSISIVQFSIPLVVALIFSLLTLVPKGDDEQSTIYVGSLVTFFSGLVACICWFVFGLTWPAVSSDVLFVSVAYLWYACGVVFGVLALYAGFRMLSAMFDNKEWRLKLEREV